MTINSNFYLYQNYYWWTNSPYALNQTYSTLTLWRISSNGLTTNDIVIVSSLSLRPVIYIKVIKLFDEVVFSGGVYLISNSDYYLKNNNDNWSISPFMFYQVLKWGNAIIWDIYYTGNFSYDNVASLRVIRPVI